jgi:hypothetical protein
MRASKQAAAPSAERSTLNVSLFVSAELPEEAQLHAEDTAYEQVQTSAPTLSIGIYVCVHPSACSSQGQPLIESAFVCLFHAVMNFAAQADRASICSERSAFAVEESSASLRDSGHTSENECDSCSTCSSRGIRFVDYDTGKPYTDMSDTLAAEYFARDVSLRTLC